MGKIYRIPYSKHGDFLQQEYRSTLALQFWVTLTVVLGITMSGFSITGEFALGLLLTPMLVFGVLSTFQTAWPRLTTTILSLISIIGLLVSAGFLLYSIIWVNWIAGPGNSCIPPNCSGFDLPYAHQLRSSIGDSIIEFAPLTGTAVLYLSALRAQLRCAVSI